MEEDLADAGTRRLRLHGPWALEVATAEATVASMVVADVVVAAASVEVAVAASGGITSVTEMEATVDLPQAHLQALVASTAATETVATAVVGMVAAMTVVTMTGVTADVMAETADLVDATADAPAATWSPSVTAGTAVTTGAMTGGTNPDATLTVAMAAGSVDTTTATATPVRCHVTERYLSSRNWWVV